jgi:adenine-specific DNA-methyltransferase
MTKNEARNIIKTVLSNEFNFKEFEYFITNLFHSSPEKINFKRSIKDAFKPQVVDYKIIGTYKDSEGKVIDILHVSLEKKETLQRARTLQRNFVADYLDYYQKEAAIVAFTVENEDEWRLSLVRLQHSLKIVNERVKAIKEITPARRWSFLVGKNEGSHTAQTRFIKLFTDEQKPNLAELESAFNIERVTEEFFDKYTELFFRLQEYLEKLIESDELLKKDFEDKEISTADFAKKTLGQIVFLYFLQKKGWFGVKAGEEWGSGNIHFMRRLFKYRKKFSGYKDNFFNDILEPLFYEGLSSDLREDSIYDRLSVGGVKYRMPFLNGGLFSPMNDYSWKTTDITIPDELFSNKKNEEDEGTGVLDVFDLYNFTVNENEPLEQEVAVDPEMLGKVFENLLKVKNRKSTGTFYTPREIVHYMCQETLINYLETETDGIERTDIELFIRKGELILENDRKTAEKNKIAESKGKTSSSHSYSFKLPSSVINNAKKIDKLLCDIKVADPAVGSGAFPLGMLNEIVRARRVVGIHTEEVQDIYELKKQTISNSLYGVDIDPGAVEIAKLRLWLSLVVDEKTPHPLPNLDHKIMQGNSLISEYEGIKLFNDSLFDGLQEISQQSLPLGKNDLELKLDDLRIKTKDFIHESNPSPKQKLKRDIDNLKWDIIEMTLSNQKQGDKMEEIKKLRRRNIKPFFIWKLEFADVFKEKSGFDVVIGNPPYILESESREAFKGLHSHNCYQGKTDIWHLFTGTGIDLLRSNGELSYIAKNQWMSSSSASNMRGYIYKNSIIRNIIDFGSNMVFENADQQTMFFFLQKNEDKNQNKTEYLKFKNNLKREDIFRELSLNLHKSNLLDSYAKVFSRNYLPENNLTFSSSVNQSLLEKIDSKKNFEFDGKNEIIQGIIGAPDKAFIVSEKGLDVFNKKEKEYLRMLYTNTGRYSTNKSEKYIFYISKNNFDGKDINNYPNIKSFFDPNKEDLIQRKINYKSPNKPYFYLHRERDERFFEEGSKLVWAKRTEGKKFTYTEKPMYGTANLFFTKSSRVNLKYLTALLNSKLMFFYMNERLKHTGDLLQIDKNQFLKIPLFVPDNIGEFTTMLDEILEITSANKYDPKNIPAEQKRLEKQIDERVIDLYELTEEEKEIVRNS